MNAPLRILLDVNVWVANLIAGERARRGTTVQRIVAVVAGGRWGEEGPPVQLVISHEMLETLGTVLKRKGVTAESAEAYSDAIMGIMRFGPAELDPYLLLGGREQFAMPDVEDAGVLATAFASRASLLVTDNLKDFQIGRQARVETRTVVTPFGTRQLYATRYRRGDIDLVVAHPVDVVAWLEQHFDPEPDALWGRLSGLPLR